MAGQTHLVKGIMRDTAEGFYANRNSLTEDNDGVFEPGYYIGVIDLSHALGAVLGKQLPQTAVYDVNFLQVGLINVNDAVDNDAYLYVNGEVRYHPPTHHRINAIQLCRQIERAKESTEIDDDSWLLRPNEDYKGFRFNWDADEQVDFATPESFSELSNSEWDLDEMLLEYSRMLDGSGVDASNALFDLKAPGDTYGFRWNAGYMHNEYSAGGVAFDDYAMGAPRIQDFSQSFSPSIKVLGGLLYFDVTGCNVDSAGILEDSYQLEVTVGVTGWEAF